MADKKLQFDSSNRADAALNNSAGFADSGAPFEHRTQEQIRFSESMELQRYFSVIASDAERRLILEFARRLAHGQSG